MNSTRYLWLASYPKSGNTWLRLLIDSLMLGGSSAGINQMKLDTAIVTHQDMQDAMGVETSDLTETEIAELRPCLYRLTAQEAPVQRLYRKLHDRCWRTPNGARVFPPELSHGAIYIVRDPRDVAISMTHLLSINLDESIAFLADEASVLSPGRTRGSTQLPQPLGTWSEHVCSWLDDSDIPLLLVRYEDMLENTERELGRIAAFAGLDTAHIQSAVRSARFDVLQQQEKQHGFKERHLHGGPFFREGKAGQWRSVLTAEQIAQIERAHRPTMQRMGYLPTTR